MKEPFKGKAISRLKKARGQIDGLITMIENDTYCIDILTQVLALQGAVRGVGPLILESHLNTCGAEGLSSRDDHRRQKFINELLQAFALSKR